MALPLVALLVVNSLADLRRNLEGTGEHSRLTAREAAASATFLLEQARVALAGLATRQAELLDPATCKATAVAMIELNPLYANLVVRNLLDEPVCAAQPGAGAPAQAVDAPSFERALRENRFVVGAPLLGPITQRWVAIARHPVRDAQGRPIGVISLPLDLANFGDAISRIESPAEGAFLLIGQRDGLILARAPDGERWVGQRTRELGEAAAAIDAGQPHVIGTDVDGVERVYGFASVPLTGWIVAAGIPTQVVYAPLRQAAAYSVAALLAVVALIFVLGARVSRAISRPIRALAEAARAVEQGRGEARARARGPTELVAVAQQFNRMLDAQEASIEALRESEASARAEHEKFESVFRAAPLPMTLSHAVGGILIDANDAYCRFFGFEHGEVVGRTALALGTWVDPAQRALLQERINRGGQVHEFPTQRRLRSGATRDVLINATPFSVNGQPCTLVTLQDITLRNLAEKALLESTELRAATLHAQQADRLKTAFLSTMSHELRTPLNAIIGFSGVLSQQLAGPLNAEQIKQLGLVQASGRQLLALVNAVLDVAHLEAGTLRMKLALLDLRASIRAVTSDATPRAESKGLALRVEVDPGIGEVLGDRQRIEQVLRNLIDNAITFARAGEITVRTTLEANVVQVHVTDPREVKGAHTAPSAVGQLLQVDDDLARNQDGTGLGLAVSARLARLMGGAITLEHEPGGGAILCWRLPRSASGLVGSAPASRAIA